MARKRKNPKPKSIMGIIIVAFVSLGVYFEEDIRDTIKLAIAKKEPSYTLEEVPSYSGKAYVTINNNVPNFNDSDYNTDSFEKYSELDILGRAKVAYANIGLDLMPTTERESIGQIKPSGWHTVRYDGLVDGNYLYNRCHLIGYQLTGKNANPKNLITCTRYMNTGAMLDFENMVANYIKDTHDNVLYRVTPIYEGTNLLASGVQIEASSVSDKCGKICFNVYIYNVQDGITIDYSNGESKLSE